MNRRQRRSSDPRTAIHLFLEAQCREIDARSLRVVDRRGEVVAAVGDDAYVDEWLPTWTLPVRGTELVVAASGGRKSPDVGLGVRRILVM